MWIVEYQLHDGTWRKILEGLPNPLSHDQACAYANALGWVTNTWHRARFVVS